MNFGVDVEVIILEWCTPSLVLQNELSFGGDSVGRTDTELRKKKRTEINRGRG